MNYPVGHFCFAFEMVVIDGGFLLAGMRCCVFLGVVLARLGGGGGMAPKPPSPAEGCGFPCFLVFSLRR